MPVTKFRDHEAARRALWTDARDPELPRRIRSLWELVTRLVPENAPRGVQKFRSIAEANREREERERARTRDLAAARRP